LKLVFVVQEVGIFEGGVVDMHPGEARKLDVAALDRTAAETGKVEKAHPEAGAVKLYGRKNAP